MAQRMAALEQSHKEEEQRAAVSKEKMQQQYDEQMRKIKEVSAIPHVAPSDNAV